MFNRALISAAVLAGVLASALPAVRVKAQTPQTASAYTPPKSSYVPPKTAWGDPDLQGIYDYQTNLWMERPPEFAGKAVLTAEDQAQFLKDHPLGFQGYNEFWATRNLVRDNRSSLLVDPPDGKLPPLTAEGQKKQAAFQAEAAARRTPGRSQYESWVDFPTVNRCIATHTPAGPMQYNSGTLIMQSPGWVVIIRERLDTRVIALDGRPHLDSSIRQWNGDSRGHWEGNTLVVDTTNFTDKQIGRGTVTGPSNGSMVQPGIPYENIHLIERFVPIDANSFHYYGTIEDPTMWTKPWTFMMIYGKEQDYQLLEYACVEGNISLENALRGERMAEQKAAEAAAKQGQK